MSLPTPPRSVQKLQASLQAKAKAERSFRFYSLWDKICREDILAEAYRRCRRNGGAPGVDGLSFAAIESQGSEPWLRNLREELVAGSYRSAPLLRVWIPKSNGKQRPLGIPTVRDRVVQMAVVLVIGAIFEADLLPEQFGFRPGRDAKAAVRHVFFQVSQHGRRDVVDADLSDYFNTIPHGPLMRCVSRRIADGRLLCVIRQWLRAPVEERAEGGVRRRTTEARDRARGTPQGGVISPLLANLYFRRFLLAWRDFGIGRRIDAKVINYADDFVICCQPGNGETAMREMRNLMARLGLTVNEDKTRLVCSPRESFDFLGYTVGEFHGRGGKPYIGTCPSKKAIIRLRQEIHDATTSRWNIMTPEDRVARLNQQLRGWSGYFNQGPVLRIYRSVEHYTLRRLRRWLMRRRGKRGTGYRQYPDEYLYETLGLFKLPLSRNDLTNAKAGGTG